MNLFRKFFVAESIDSVIGGGYNDKKASLPEGGGFAVGEDGRSRNHNDGKTPTPSVAVRQLTPKFEKTKGEKQCLTFDFQNIFSKKKTHKS